MVVKNFPACARSLSPLEKKKLAPSCFYSAHFRASVRVIVDLLIPAIPLSQKMRALFGVLFDQCATSLTTPIQVSFKHRGSCSRCREENLAPLVQWVLAARSCTNELMSIALLSSLTY